MTITHEQIRAHINLDHIEAAAVNTAQKIQVLGAAKVRLTPNDGTVYVFIITRLPIWLVNHGTGEAEMAPPEPDYDVTLRGPIGSSYQWAGQPIEPDYASEKWTPDRHRWTGVVVSEFLTRISRHLRSTPV